MSIFGSVGRGDYHSKSDIDLYFDFDTSKHSDFGLSQQALTELQRELAQAANRQISLHFELFGEQTDDAAATVSGPDAIVLASRPDW